MVAGTSLTTDGKEKARHWKVSSAFRIWVLTDHQATIVTNAQPLICRGSSLRRDVHMMNSYGCHKPGVNPQTVLLLMSGVISDAFESGCLLRLSNACTINT